MKILHIIATVVRSSGGPIEGILQQNATLGEDIGREVLCFDPPGADWISDFPIRVHALGYKLGSFAVLIPKRKYGFSLRALFWLIRNAKNYDIIVVNGLWNFSTAVMSVARHFTNTPYVVYPHGMLDPWFLLNKPFKRILKRMSWLTIERGLLRDAAAVLFTTAEEQHQAAIGYSSKYNARITKYGTTSPPSIGSDVIDEFRSVYNIPSDRKYLLFLGRIHEKKGVDLLIQGFARTANSHDLSLIIAGPVEKPYEAYLHNLVSALKIENRVHWTGMLTGEAKYAVLRVSCAFILPSHQENFGIAVAEALSTSCPVIVSDKVNIFSDIESAAAGIVIEDTEAGVVRGIESFISMSDSEIEKMSENGLRLFDREYNLERNMGELLALYRDITNPAKPS